MKEFPNFVISEEVKHALENNIPVVALETSIVSHGMPYPVNVKTALEVEEEVRKQGAVPASIGVYKGQIIVGMNKEQLYGISNNPDDPSTKAMKASIKGIPMAVSQGLNAGFTIAGIIRCANMAGIRVMATGGIGGVAKGGELSMDVSADLGEMGRTNIAIVSAGCKSILDIGRTKEVLETNDVPVIGMGCDSFPAFFVPYSKYRIDYRIDDYMEVAKFIKAKCDLDFEGAVICSNPVPKEYAMEEDYIEGIIARAVEEAKELGIDGEKSTPFLLGKVLEYTNGKSLETNIEIVKNNGRVAAIIAKNLCELYK